MKTCLTIDFFPVRGGAHTVVFAHAACLSKLGGVVIVSLRPSSLSEESPFQTETLNVYRDQPSPATPATDFAYCLLGLLRLLKIRKRYGISLIFAQDMVFTGLYSSLAGRILGVPVIVADYGPAVNFRNDEYWKPEQGSSSLLSRAIIRIQRALALWAAVVTLRLAPKIIVTGVEHDKLVHQILKGDRISKVRYYDFAVDTSRFSPIPPAEKSLLRLSLGIPSNAIVVTIVSRLTRIKGLTYVTEVLIKLMQTTLNLYVLIVGGGGGHLKRELMDMAIQSKVGERMKFIGSVRWENVHKYLQVADIFVYGGTAGSCTSLGLLEAMASGCCVVASDSPLSHQVILNGANGICFKYGDASSLEHILRKLVNSNGLRRVMSTSAVKYARSLHSLDSLCERLDELLREDRNHYESWVEYHKARALHQ